ncbi:MAG: flagellar assembly protein FliW [Desulfobaccales bacterium]|nr:flagellar assembly protein FliW [Desulfobaccales bacterium]
MREEQIITFTSGLWGFSQFHRYVLIERPQELPFLWLLSVDNPDLALVVMDPAELVADYQVQVSDAVLKDLAAETLDDLRVLVTLTIPPGRAQDATANLRAPLLLNLNAARGKQVVLENQAYSQAHPLFPR